MRLLLDTHVWIWYLTGSPSISSSIRNALEDDENEVFLAPISVWEALLLGEKGRIQFQPDPPTWVRMALERFPVIEAPLNHEIAILSRTVDLPHPDQAELLLEAGRLEESREAFRSLTAASYADGVHFLGTTYMRLAEIHERLGDREKAVEYYARLLRLWKNCDPELIPIREDARRNFDRLLEDSVREPPSG